MLELVLFILLFLSHVFICLKTAEIRSSIYHFFLQKHFSGKIFESPNNLYKNNFWAVATVSFNFFQFLESVDDFV